MKKTIFLLALLLLVGGAVTSWAGVFMNVPWYTTWGNTPSTIYSTWTWHYQRDENIKGVRCSCFHNDQNNIVMLLEYNNNNELIGATYYTESADVGAFMLTSLVKYYGQGHAKAGGGVVWNLSDETVTMEIDKGITVFEDAN